MYSALEQRVLQCIASKHEEDAWDFKKSWHTKKSDLLHDIKYSLQGTTQGRYLTGGVPPVRFSM